jgi:hypothetical protein
MEKTNFEKAYEVRKQVAAIRAKGYNALDRRLQYAVDAIEGIGYTRDYAMTVVIESDLIHN